VERLCAFPPGNRGLAKIPAFVQPSGLSGRVGQAPEKGHLITTKSLRLKFSFATANSGSRLRFGQPPPLTPVGAVGGGYRLSQLGWVMPGSGRFVYYVGFNQKGAVVPRPAGADKVQPGRSRACGNASVGDDRVHRIITGVAANNIQVLLHGIALGLARLFSNVADVKLQRARMLYGLGNSGDEQVGDDAGVEASRPDDN